MQLQRVTLPRAFQRERTIVLLVWSCVAIVAVFQALLLARVPGGIDLFVAVTSRLSIVPLWALATPLILRSGRRWPVLPDLNVGHLLVHVTLGSLFIAITNTAIQLPLLHTGIDPVQSAIRDIAENYPPALIVYLVIVALGHVRKRPAAQEAPARERLTIRQWNRVHFLALEDIDWIEAEDNYVIVHAAGRSYKTRERISAVANRLDPHRFIRIHRSAIVHVARIREVQRLTHGDQAVILRDGTLLRASRNRRDALSEALAVQL